MHSCIFHWLRAFSSFFMANPAQIETLNGNMCLNVFCWKNPVETNLLNNIRKSLGSIPFWVVFPRTYELCKKKKNSTLSVFPRICCYFIISFQVCAHIMYRSYRGLRQSSCEHCHHPYIFSLIISNQCIEKLCDWIVEEAT